MEDFYFDRFTYNYMYAYDDYSKVNNQIQHDYMKDSVYYVDLKLNKLRRIKQEKFIKIINEDVVVNTTYQDRYVVLKNRYECQKYLVCNS